MGQSSCKHRFYLLRSSSYSVIDHFIVSSHIYDLITANNVLCDPTNISLHNAISLSMSNFGCQPIISINSNMHRSTSKRCNWNKAQCTLYSMNLDDTLENIGLSSSLVKCKYLNCKNCDDQTVIILMLYIYMIFISYII